MAYTLSQEPEQLDLKWTEHDPVSMTFTVAGVDWSGSYTSQVRDTKSGTGTVLLTLTVVGTYDGTNTAVTIVAADTSSLNAGTYWYDAQQTGGITRFAGKVLVKPQVSA